MMTTAIPSANIFTIRAKADAAAVLGQDVKSMEQRSMMASRSETVVVAK